MIQFRRTVTALALLLLAACADQAGLTAPAVSPAHFARNPGSQALRFVHRAPATPPFKSATVMLDAQAGQSGSVTLSFADGSPFARFSVSAETMRGATLKGAPLPADQPLTITLKRVDASRYVLDLQPSGLVFNPDAPASIEFYYDGAVLPAADVAIFKQDRVGDAWTRTPSSDDGHRRVMKGRVDDFTIYAMAAPH